MDAEPTVRRETKLARGLRRRETDAERKLWSKLRGSQLGVKFRRQQPIRNYVVDFVCYEKKLIVEVDGGGHNTLTGIQSDAERTENLRRYGFKVVRFWDNDVLNNIEGVAARIVEYMEADNSSDSPSP